VDAGLIHFSCRIRAGSERMLPLKPARGKSALFPSKNKRVRQLEPGEAGRWFAVVRDRGCGVLQQPAGAASTLSGARGGAPIPRGGRGLPPSREEALRR